VGLDLSKDLLSVRLLGMSWTEALPRSARRRWLRSDLASDLRKQTMFGSLAAPPPRCNSWRAGEYLTVQMQPRRPDPKQLRDSWVKDLCDRETNMPGAGSSLRSTPRRCCRGASVKNLAFGASL